MISSRMGLGLQLRHVFSASASLPPRSASAPSGTYLPGTLRIRTRAYESAVVSGWLYWVAAGPPLGIRWAFTASGPQPPIIVKQQRTILAPLGGPEDNSISDGGKREKISIDPYYFTHRQILQGPLPPLLLSL